jgi:hypothetical protein
VGGPEVPRSIAGYVLEERLGQGGMGVVFRASHPQFPGRAFALKLLLDEVDSTPDGVARFQREMSLVARASNHPAVVRVFGGSIEGVRPYFVMELVAGRSLAEVARDAPLAPKQAAEVARQVADAIAHVHSLGIIHRDLKPENILLEPSGRARILDFGLSKIAQSTSLTKTGASLGTPAYSAPEQLDGSAKTANATADVYALGAVLSFALTGHPPFEAHSGPALLKKVLVDPARAPSSLVPAVPPELDAICLHALEKPSAARYPSAAALRDDLDRFLAGEPVSVKPPTAADVFRSWRRRHRRTLLVGGFLAVLAAGTSAGVLYERERHYRNIDRPFAEALEPGRSSSEIRARIGVLVENGAEPERLDRVHVALLRAVESEVAPKLDKIERKDEDDLFNAAVGALRSVNLVGEVSGSPIAVGDLFLDVGSPENLDPWKKADELAKKRLALDGNDRAARALRAYVALARAGAPVRPLERGHLGLVPAPEVERDLAAAADLDGPPGERAAWLLVDLYLSAGSRAVKERDAALETARQRFPSAPAGQALEEVCRLQGSPDEFRQLVLGLAGDDRRRAAFQLSRFFAKLDAPEVVDAPELVAATDGALAPAVTSIVAREKSPNAPPEIALERFYPVEAVEEPGWPPSREPGENAYPKEWVQRMKAGDKDGSARAEFVRLIAKCPRGFSNLLWSGDPEVARLATPVHYLLSYRCSCGPSGLANCFSKATRLGNRSVLEYELEMHEKHPDVDFVFPADVWETTKKGIAACEEFDARLEEDVKADDFLRAAQEAPRTPVPEIDVRRAKSGSKGLRRLEELVASADEVPPGDRSRLAFDALLQFEDIRLLGGLQVLAFRTRLRLVAFPGALGVGLARLDLERILELARGAGARLKKRGRAPDYFQNWHWLLLHAAATASLLPHDRGRGLHRALYELAVRWNREYVLAFVESHTNETVTQTIARITESLGNTAQELLNKDYFAPLLSSGDYTESDFARDFKITPDEDRRIRAICAGKSYEFHDPAH